MILWLILAAMTALALGFVLSPLIRRGDGETARLGHDIAVYRDQLAEVDRDLDLGVISPTLIHRGRRPLWRGYPRR